MRGELGSLCETAYRRSGRESRRDDHGDAGADSTREELVKKMVRLALACEYQRKPIRRTEISEKVLGNNASRRFKEVFNGAQVELRSVFGMEMVELPGREKITVAQKRGKCCQFLGLFRPFTNAKHCSCTEISITGLKADYFLDLNLYPAIKISGSRYTGSFSSTII